jgi:Glycosyl transferase family 2
MATITVSIPTYNRSSYLRMALHSVFAQSFSNFEILISDNGSDDGTEDLVTEYAKKDSRIIYHRFEKNCGVASNLKYVLTRPQTEFIALLPDDDLWLPHHLAHALDAFQSVPNAVLYGCTAEFFGEESGHRFHRPYWAEGCKSQKAINTAKEFAPFLKEVPLAPVSVVFRSSARDGAIWYGDDGLGAQDWLFWGQVALHGLTVFEPSVGVRLRWHSGNLSHTLLGGRRANVHFRYVMRHLATLALHKGAFTTTDLIREVESWPIGSVANLVVALASRDTHPTLREVAFELFHKMPWVGVSPESTKHCRMAGRVGSWYLGFADMLDRVLARWWRPCHELKSSSIHAHLVARPSLHLCEEKKHE